MSFLFVVTAMTARVMPAGVTALFTVMVMTALHSRVILKPAGKIFLHRGLNVAFRARDQLNARCLQRHFRAAADSAADEQ